MSYLSITSVPYALVQEVPAISRYAIEQEIGKGTHSTVFLAKNRLGESFVVKQYEITGEEEISLLTEMGTTPAAYAKTLAMREFEIGQRADHPHIVKVRDVWHQDAKSYVVMDYVSGESLDKGGDLRNCSLTIRLSLAGQLLSAIEHLLMRGIIIDDLWSGNLMISNSSHLMLVDLGGNDFIDQKLDNPLSHYTEMITSALLMVAGPSVNSAIERCDPLLSGDLRKETIDPTHVQSLLVWIGALQNELKDLVI